MLLSPEDMDSFEEPRETDSPKDPEEERVLAAAAAIKKQLALTRAAGSRDPERNTTHWDQLLAEMKWMSEDFARERKWRLNQGKIFARRAQRGLLDVETKEKHQQREETLQRMKMCSAIAQEVQRFWRKAERVVNFKIQQTIERKKKEVLNKHLVFLVGQTERYSSMLAKNLLQAQEEDTEEEFHTKSTSNKDKPDNIQDSLFEGSAPGPGDHYNHVLESLVQDSRPSKRHKSDEGNEDHSWNTMTLLETSQNAVQSCEDTNSGSGSSRLTQEDQDDESTLDQEELMAAATETPFQFENETETLANEATAPIDEILKSYGIEPGAELKNSQQTENLQTLTTLSTDDHTKTCTNGVVGTRSDPDVRLMNASDKNLAEHANNPMFDPGGLAEEQCNADTQNYDQNGSPSTPHLDMAEDSDEDFITDVMDAEEYIDDERTLDVEEELQKASGDVDTAKELCNLMEEADIPLEELLKRYSMNVLDTADGSSCELADENPKTGGVYKSNSNNYEQAQTVLEESIVDGNTTGEPSLQDCGTGDALADVTDFASKAQPLGYTLSSCDVHTNVPFLLKHSLREYQHIGLDWLVTLYKKRINGILADEMGLGKTIQTISLLGWLACEEGVWGPHLIVVPTSVMLNWEMEFKKWCPAFKLLTYYGNAKERKAKRQGWSKPNTFHVCITSYTLILQDAKMFRRKKWKYLILDEAHMIKNWKSQRWQTLLNFNSKRRLLLTGTPLQNDLMELWSLMHFLMPHVFTSHAQFKDWFSNPLTGMVQGQSEVNQNLVERLHGVLRPFLLRRLKAEVEKQLPQKHHHIIHCRLSKRQRNLYEEYMASSDAKTALASGSYLGMINVLMQLRKVCNHPDLFAGRSIVSPLDIAGIEVKWPDLCTDMWNTKCALESFQTINLLPSACEEMTTWQASDILELRISEDELLKDLPEDPFWLSGLQTIQRFRQKGVSQGALDVLTHSMQETSNMRDQWRHSRLCFLAHINNARCQNRPIYGCDLLQTVKCIMYILGMAPQSSCLWDQHPAGIIDAVQSYDRRAAACDIMLQNFLCYIPKARTPPAVYWTFRPTTLMIQKASWKRNRIEQEYRQRSELLWTSSVRRQIFFPDKRLVQFDCGKLQELAVLMHQLQTGGHRVLIFTQMSKMLDILEIFLNIHGFTYMRLDGSTKPEQRQVLMQKFNNDTRTFAFILSTRSGGIGVNLTGADTVIFYDSDWNPAMDLQAQDRCHRIGQTREVHIYRFVTEHTIEENILRKSDEKRHLDFLAIQSGGFNLDFLQRLSPSDLLGVPSSAEIKAAMHNAEDEVDATAAAEAEKEAAEELEEFTVEPPLNFQSPANHGEHDAEMDPENDQGATACAYATSSSDKDEKDEECGSDASLKVDDDNKEEHDHEHPTAIKNQSADIKAQGRGIVGENIEEDEGFGGLNQGMVGSEEMALLLENFLPIEKFAIRSIESLHRTIDIEAAALQTVADVEEKEWVLDEIEEKKELADHEIDMDDEEWVDAWDRTAATEEYKTEVEAAQKLAEEKRRELEEYLEYLASLPPEPVRPKPAKRSKAKVSSAQYKTQKRSRAPSSPASTSSWSAEDELGSRKRHKHEAHKQDQPSTVHDALWEQINPPFLVHSNAWKVEDDLVLSFMVKHATEGLLMEGKISGNDLFIPEGVWVVAAEALEQGVANPHCEFDEGEPFVPSVSRTARECKTRYSQLLMSCANSCMPDVLGIPQRQCITALREVHRLLLAKIADFVSTSKDMQDVTALWQQLARDSGGRTLPECIQLLMKILKDTSWPDCSVCPGLNIEERLRVVPLSADIILSTVMQFHGERGTRLNKKLVSILSDMDKAATSGEIQQALRITLKGAKPRKDTSVKHDNTAGGPRQFLSQVQRGATSQHSMGNAGQRPVIGVGRGYALGSSTLQRAWGGPIPGPTTVNRNVMADYRAPTSIHSFPLPLRQDYPRAPANAGGYTEQAQNPSGHMSQAQQKGYQYPFVVPYSSLPSERHAGLASLPNAGQHANSMTADQVQAFIQRLQLQQHQQRQQVGGMCTLPSHDYTRAAQPTMASAYEVRSMDARMPFTAGPPALVVPQMPFNSERAQAPGGMLGLTTARSSNIPDSNKQPVSNSAHAAMHSLKSVLDDHDLSKHSVLEAGPQRKAHQSTLLIPSSSTVGAIPNTMCHTVRSETSGLWSSWQATGLQQTSLPGQCPGAAALVTSRAVEFGLQNHGLDVGAQQGIRSGILLEPTVHSPHIRARPDIASPFQLPHGERGHILPSGIYTSKDVQYFARPAHTDSKLQQSIVYPEIGQVGSDACADLLPQNTVQQSRVQTLSQAPPSVQRMQHVIEDPIHSAQAHQRVDLQGLAIISSSKQTGSGLDLLPSKKDFGKPDGNAEQN